MCFRVGGVGLVIDNDWWGILKNAWRVFLLGGGVNFGGMLTDGLGLVREGTWRTPWVGVGVNDSSMGRSMFGMEVGEDGSQWQSYWSS